MAWYDVVFMLLVLFPKITMEDVNTFISNKTGLINIGNRISKGE